MITRVFSENDLILVIAIMGDLIVLSLFGDHKSQIHQLLSELHSDSGIVFQQELNSFDFLLSGLPIIVVDDDIMHHIMSSKIFIHIMSGF